MLENYSLIPSGFFLAQKNIPYNAVTGEYQTGMVFLSYLVASIAAYAAISVLLKINIADKNSRRWGCFFGALVMGIGIWSMHFVGMLAFKIDMVHDYQPTLTALSMLIATGFSSAVFYNITAAQFTLKRIFINAPIMGLGVAAMHYVGMEAMQMQGEIKYTPLLFVLSIIIAVLASGAAMWIMRFVFEVRKNQNLLQVIAAAVMGAAVCGMHYTGIAASVFIPYADCLFDPNQTHEALAALVALGAFACIFTVLLLRAQAFLKRHFTIFATVLFLLPFGGATYLFSHGVNNDIYFTERERVGVKYHNALFKIMRAMQDYRGTLFLSKNLGDGNEGIETLKESFIKQIKIAESLQDDASSLGIQPLWQSTRKSLLETINRSPSSIPIDIFEQQSTAISSLKLLMQEVGNKSNLILDPEIETYFMVNVIINTIPDLVEELGHTRGKISGLLAAGILSESERNNMIEVKGRLRGLTERYHYSVGVINNNDPEGVSSKVENQVRAIDKLEKTFNVWQKILDGRAHSSSYNAFFDDTSKTMAAFDEAYQKFSEHLDWRLHERLKTKKLYRLKGILALVTMLSLTITVFFFARRNMVRNEEVENARYVQAILNYSRYAIISADTNGKIISFNKAAEQMLGYLEKEVIGQSPALWHDKNEVTQRAEELSHELGRKIEPGFEVFVIKSTLGKNEEREWSFIRKDGTILPVTLAITALKDTHGNITGYVGIAHDISERKKAEQTIKDKEAKLAAIVNNTVDGLITIDERGNVETFNHACENIFGYSTHEVIGKNVKMLMPEPYHGGHDGYLKHYQETKERKVIGIGREVQGKRRNGEIFPLDLSVSEINIGGKKMYSGIVRDISERKMAEERLAQYAATMEIQNIEMKIAHEQAEHANKMKSEFLAMMSHEIRTPMNGILGMTELLIDSGLTHRQQDYARTVMGSAETLLTIINDILDFSKIEAGKMELESIPFDFQSLVEDTAELLAVKAREKAVELIVRYVPGTSRSFLGDPTRIRQLITNLTGNAIKFTEKGRILITVEEIGCSLEKQDTSTIKISVSDTGIGIPREAQAKLFQKFSQVDGSTTRKFGGTGLGLAICKQLAEMMHGEIDVLSEEGLGSTFWVTIEMPQHVGKSVEREMHDITDLQGLRALIVDDVADNITIISEQLAVVGIQCTGCTDATAVQALLTEAKNKGEPFQIAILDYIMPTLSGETLAKMIKSTDSPVKDTLLMILTSAGGTGFGKRFAEAGISAYLSKPLHSAQLIETLNYVWHAYRDGRTEGLINTDNIRTSIKAESNVRFDGARILLAEDNRINQGFAIEILEGLGAVIGLAVNGKEAIEKIQTEPYDLVLMDCQMPIMDGFEASHILTTLKREGKIKDIPVIALTANAMKGDKERCIAAGMNDYIAKPMRKIDLINGLMKWLPSGIMKNTEEPLTTEQPTKKIFKDVHVLLVEDNRVNREFAVEILEGMGCLVTTAENGKVGLQRIHNNSFDVILMDVQMPVMDGLEASREIRAMSDSGAIKYIPIIALTANALKGDREKCLAAGMDDYVPKPVKRQQIADALKKWLPESKLYDADTAKEDVVDTQILKSMREVMHTKFSAFVRLYLEDTQFHIQKLNHLARNGRPAGEAIITAHTLKSTSRYLGALQLADIAEKMELRASLLSKDGADATTLLASIVQMEVLYQDVRSSLLTYISAFEKQEAA